MMNRFLLIVASLIILNSASATDSLAIYSPDGSIHVLINTKNGLSYQVFVDGKVCMLPSQIDLTLNDGTRLSNSFSIRSIDRRQVDETITAPLPDKRKFIPDRYDECKFVLKTPFEIIFRVYNDGFAYRIVTRFKDSVVVRHETTGFQFKSSSRVIAPIMHPRENQDIYHTSFEELYQNKPLDSFSNQELSFNPLLIDEGEVKLGVTESDLDDYPGMFLRGTNSNVLQGEFASYPLEERIEGGEFPESIVSKRANYIARIPGTKNLPWRVIIIARKDKDLPANDLVYRLGSPSRIKDISWIQGGKCTDEWIIDVNLFNVPFKSGVNTASYKYYIDFAKKFGFDRIMMDAGWSDAIDLFKINSNINMDTIVAYARLQGIKICMWTLSMTLDKQLERALDQFNQWGVDFIMTDFIDRDDQKTVRFYSRIAEACANHKIMIMFHGAYPPKGFNRTFPNNIVREGVLGSEYNAWSDKVSPQHDLTLPFTRMLAGPMDYEPGILDNATQSQFRPIWGKVMTQGTRCHQLAMFIVYDDPMPIFSGNPSQGMKEPAFMNFLRSFPSTWDTTIIIDAKLSSYILTARKKGSDWFIGGMCDWNAKTFEFPLDFLDEGKYEATEFMDGVNADRYPSDYVSTTSTVSKKDKLTVKMAPGGGFVIRISGTGKNGGH
ncbi:MAG TPA: glycoside hydrolase family 97 protein [Puia sp.]|nr:glycoside hydrolase family 97 protein [Puia sp.]